MSLRGYLGRWASVDGMMSISGYAIEIGKLYNMDLASS